MEKISEDLTFKALAIFPSTSIDGLRSDRSIFE